jgi:hypothetical protein
VCDTREGGCDGVKCVADALEDHVRDTVIAAFNAPEVDAKVRRRLVAKLAGPAREQELQAQKQTAKEALARLGDDDADGLLTGVQGKRATRRLQLRIDAADEELAGNRRQAGIMVELAESAEAMRRAWDGWDLAPRRQIIGSAVKRVWVKHAGQGQALH